MYAGEGGAGEGRAGEGGAGTEPGAQGGASNTAGSGSGGASADGGAGGEPGSVCEPGSQTCVGNVIALCADTGGGYASFENCSTNQTCVQDGEAARCEDQVCVPDAADCASPRVVRQCASDGLSFDLVDCEVSGQYCVSGACNPQLCTPNARFCSANAIHECNADGSASEQVTPCGSGQYCDDSSPPPSCATQVCTPNESVCDMNFSKTCNAAGSGYVGPGEDCAQRGCALGVCRDILYAEDFESGTQGNMGYGDYTNAVSGAAAADGTDYGYRMIGATNQADASGAVLPPIVPVYVSYWVRPHATNARSGYFALTASEEGLASNTIVETSFHSSGWIRVGLDPDQDIVQYSANEWYHFELELDWSARTVRITINGQNYGLYPIYHYSATTVRSLWLWSFDSSTTDWDEILLR